MTGTLGRLQWLYYDPYTISLFDFYEQTTKQVVPVHASIPSLAQHVKNGTARYVPMEYSEDGSLLIPEHSALIVRYFVIAQLNFTNLFYINRLIMTLNLNIIKVLQLMSYLNSSMVLLPTILCIYFVSHITYIWTLQ